jgi:F-type H+-transporting ATPase subunit delta
LALLLVSKGLFGHSPEISRIYGELFDAHRGIERAKVITALTLDEKEKEAIAIRLAKISDRKVAVDGYVDPSIIGGFIARMGDTLIDGSVHQKLETLKRNLIEVGR